MKDLNSIIKEYRELIVDLASVAGKVRTDHMTKDYINDLLLGQIKLKAVIDEIKAAAYIKSEFTVDEVLDLLEKLKVNLGEVN